MATYLRFINRLNRLSPVQRAGAISQVGRRDKRAKLQAPSPIIRQWANSNKSRSGRPYCLPAQCNPSAWPGWLGQYWRPTRPSKQNLDETGPTRFRVGPCGHSCSIQAKLVSSTFYSRLSNALCGRAHDTRKHGTTQTKTQSQPM